VDAWWAALLRDQRSGRFPDLAGGAAAITLPVSDRLLTEVVGRLIAERAGPVGPVADLEILASPGNILTVRGRLTKSPIPLRIDVRLAIEQQPELPRSPVLALAIVSRGLVGMTAGFLKYIDVLPPGITFDGRRFAIDLAALSTRYGAAEVFSYLTELKITTAEHIVIVHARAEAPPQR
jgi:hypothetical protein